MSNKSSFAGRRVLVTGGAGAFGQKLIAALAAEPPAKLLVYSRDEMKHAALKRQLGSSAPWVQFRIGDINNGEELGLAMAQADIVIHAAAMKHLPECEANVGASTYTNVFGTQTVARTFLRSDAETLIFLSTDKSPYASSVYGAQKYIGEKVMTETSAFATGKKRALSLRYSNVIDSTGAAFHIFGDMLRAGKNVTVNGSQTVRGFVTQAEVISCIETALQHASGGENFVLKPRVIRISELATTMCSILGKGEVEVREENSFLGEKDSATLIMAEERGVAKACPEAAGETFLLDYLGRHPKRSPAVFEQDGPLTLEDCPLLEQATLKQFLTPVMQANKLI